LQCPLAALQCLSMALQGTQRAAIVVRFGNRA
jgi:hypothetical protein